MPCKIEMNISFIRLWRKCEFVLVQHGIYSVIHSPCNCWPAVLDLLSGAGYIVEDVQTSVRYLHPTGL